MKLISKYFTLLLAFAFAAVVNVVSAAQSQDENNRQIIKGFLCRNLTPATYSAETVESADLPGRFSSDQIVCQDDYSEFVPSAGIDEVVIRLVPKSKKDPVLVSEAVYAVDADSPVYAVYDLLSSDGILKLAFAGYSFENSPERKEVKLNDVFFPEPLYKEVDTDQVDARRGFVAGTEMKSPVVEESGRVAWNMPGYDFLNGKEVPQTVHPNLWRMEQLNNINGVFQVLPMVEEGGKDGFIYQVRGYDISTMSFIKGKNGWIVIDPFTAIATASEAWKAFKEAVDPDAKVSAVLITHSHADHYMGLLGLINPEDIWPISLEEYLALGDDDEKIAEVSGGKTLVVAPDGFYDEAISENLYLGNSMIRRANYMYGSTISADEYGHVGSGLGKTAISASGALMAPSFELVTGAEGIRDLHIDGLSFRFQNVPGTEAPAEFHIFVKEYKALCPGENVCMTMHNLLTPRGAKVRDPKAFGNAIDEALEIALGYFGGTIDVIIGTHHWPTWGKENCINLMTKQRDMYYFFNNQVIHMMNKGMNMEEIAEVFTLPASLHGEYFNRGYYGTLNHDVKAVFQRYAGWWDGNPANYYKYPEVEAARRFVNDMGGEKAVLKKARQYFRKGDYRWTVELTRNLVFNNPDNMEARFLEADALEQLGYSFEAGTWRNIFLTGAKELRQGTPAAVPPSATLKYYMANFMTMSPDYIFEYWGILLDGADAGKDNADISLNVKVGDQCYNLHLVNGVLHHKPVENVTPDVEFAVLKDLVTNFGSRMAALNPDQGKGQKPGADPLDSLYQYFEIFNLNWSIIEPLK